MLCKFFNENFGQFKVATSAIERSKEYQKARKWIAPWFDYYEKNALKDSGTVNNLSGAKIFTKLPEPTDEDKLMYKKDLYPIFNEFNYQGISLDAVQERLEGYLQNIMSGFDVRINALKEKSGKQPG